MASTSGPFYSYKESQTTGLLKRSVDPIIRTIDPKFVPMREAFGYNGFTADALKVEYLERNDTPIIGSIGTAATGYAEKDSGLYKFFLIKGMLKLQTLTKQGTLISE